MFFVKKITYVQLSRRKDSALLLSFFLKTLLSCPFFYDTENLRPMLASFFLSSLCNCYYMIIVSQIQQGILQCYGQVIIPDPWVFRPKNPESLKKELYSVYCFDCFLFCNIFWNVALIAIVKTLRFLQKNNAMSRFSWSSYEKLPMKFMPSLIVFVLLCIDFYRNKEKIRDDFYKTESHLQ